MRFPLSPQSLTVFATKGYKMKTHKASAKRFRVTGKGKIVRRRAGKQHLLAKKNTKRKFCLSKMHEVSRSDYDNVIGALPYLKVDRNAKCRASSSSVI
ncbi:50S ribosomal protein L35 [Hibiscus syriacus]|uniref:50S ribosomal protein L35 n=1 Tax=Hibiscus syriacus TaxID=106335 RepID=A0A6A2Z6C3_HIBSY|nr:50S ribosomal protein L35 [Hibiscus syriacus]